MKTTINKSLRHRPSQGAVSNAGVGGVLYVAANIEDFNTAHGQRADIVIVYAAVPANLYLRFEAPDERYFVDQLQIGLAAKMAQVAGKDKYVIDPIKCRADKLNRRFGFERHTHLDAVAVHKLGKRYKLTFGFGVDDDHLRAQAQVCFVMSKRL